MFRKTNTFMLAITGLIACGFTLSLARAAYAWFDPSEGVCANQIGSVTPPLDYTLDKQTPFGTTCHQSSAFYDYDDLTHQVALNGPYYRCCGYNRTLLNFISSQDGRMWLHASMVEYFHDRTVGAGACLGTWGSGTSNQDNQCINQ